MATRKFNLRTESDEKLNVSPDSIPNISPESSIALFRQEGETPYYKIQAIEYPTKANGWLYTEEFWDSYLKRLSRAPFPGSKNGHDTRWGARGSTDLLVIGGKMQKNGDGSGVVYLKNYIPLKGESGDNSTFIAMNKAGMLDYSIVSFTKDVVETLPDGTVVRKCVESLSGERNDAVDYGTGAMGMKTNAASQVINTDAVAQAKRLISAGKVDSTSRWKPTAADENKLLGDNDWASYASWHLIEDESEPEETKARYKYLYGMNGKVYRSALRAIASRAAQQDLQELSEIASEMLKSLDAKTKENHTMDKQELLDALATLKANNGVTLAEVAGAMGLESQLKTNADVDSLAKFNEIKTVLGDDPIAAAKKLSADAESASAAAREKALTDLVGPKANNDRYTYADRFTAGLTGEKFNAALEALKTDPIMLRLSADAADMNSAVNIVAGGETKKQNAYNGSVVTL